MKVAPRQLSGFLASIPQHIRAVLLHGSDVGLITERGAGIAAQFSDDLDDAFRSRGSTATRCHPIPRRSAMPRHPCP